MGVKEKTIRCKFSMQRHLSMIALCMCCLYITACSDSVGGDRLQRDAFQNNPDLPEPLAEAADSLNVLIWRDYFPESLFETFENLYGVKINVHYFGNNEELRRIYYEDPGKWDLLMPSDYMVSILRREGQLSELEKDNLSHMGDLIPNLFDVDFDPGLNFFIPYFYATLGISFTVDYISGFPRSWQFLEQHDNNPFIAKRIAFKDQMRVAIGFALLQLGEDINSRDPEVIARACDYLVHLRRDFGASIVGDEIIEEEAWKDYVLLIQWSGTAAYLLSLDLSYRFLIPEGPAIVAIDGFVIPKESQKKRTAHLFLDFLMAPQVFAISSDYSYYAPCSYVAERHVSSFVRYGPSLLLPREEKWVTLEDVGEAGQHYESGWSRVKATQPNEQLRALPLPLK
jgi:spermidine/putrescine transport system substrate-binding protein